MFIYLISIILLIKMAKSKLDLFFISGSIYSNFATIFLIKQDYHKHDK